MKGSAIPAAHWLLAALVAPALFAGCSPTATYGTGQSPEIALFREVTGGILGSRKKESIDYQPRAPLVMPPAQQLPEPVETASAASPDWPGDPDTRLASTAGPSHQRKPGDEMRGGTGKAEYRRLKPLVGVLPGGSDKQPQWDNHATALDVVHSGKQQREAFKKALADAKGLSKERRFLTDPPEEYREPAETAPSEFEDINANGKRKGRGLMGFFRRNDPHPY